MHGFLTLHTNIIQKHSKHNNTYQNQVDQFTTYRIALHCFQKSASTITCLLLIHWFRCPHSVSQANSQVILVQLCTYSLSSVALFSLLQNLFTGSSILCHWVLKGVCLFSCVICKVHILKFTLCSLNTLIWENLV